MEGNCDLSRKTYFRENGMYVVIKLSFKDTRLGHPTYLFIFADITFSCQGFLNVKH